MRGLLQLLLSAALVTGPCLRVCAQERPVGMRPLRELLAEGEIVRVTTQGGRTLFGRIERVSASEFLLSVSRCRSGTPPTVGGWSPNYAAVEPCPGEIGLGLADVRLVSRSYRDGVGNGALIGFGSVWALNLATIWVQDFDGDAGAWFGSWSKASLLGAGVGALLDGLVSGWEDIYRWEGRTNGVGARLLPYPGNSPFGISFKVVF